MSARASSIASDPGGLAGDRADAIDQRQQLRDVVAVGAGVGGQQRDAGGVADDVCLVPARVGSTGEGPVRAPSQGADLAAVHDPSRPVKLPDRVQAAQQLAVHTLTHAGGLPVPKPPPRRHARAANLLDTMRHGTPVTSTNTIAVNAARRSVGALLGAWDQMSSTGGLLSFPR